MTTIRRLAAVLGLACATACTLAPEPEGEPAACLAPRASAGAEHPRGAAYQAALDAVIDDIGVPGIVMAVRDADGVWEGAAGLVDLGRQTPMRACHRTRIASVTKTFVAVTIMMLVEDDLLDLDAPITDYIPDRTRDLAHASQITIRQLLTHTSGVYNFLDVAFALELFNRPTRTWRLNQCYTHALRGAPEFSPGEGWSYSNTNYLLLADIIEEVTGTSHEQVMRARIFEPLGLTETTYAPDRFEFPGIAHGYFDIYGDNVLIDSTDTYANNCVGPDGGMASSAIDVLTFFDALFSARTLVSEASLASMWPVVPTGETLFPHYGFGLETWVSDGYVAVGHGGHEFGYRTFAYYFPDDDVTFVVWVNASSLVPTKDNVATVIDAARDQLREVVLGPR